MPQHTAPAAELDRLLASWRRHLRAQRMSAARHLTARPAPSSADTGARRGEVVGLRLADVDLDVGLLTVTGEGSRRRAVAIGDQAVRALDRYLRVRAKHPA